MRSVLRLALLAALFAFGSVAANVTPMYAYFSECIGRSDLVCEAQEVERCVRRTVCGVTSDGLKLCCAEKEKTTDYFYWEDAY